MLSVDGVTGGEKTHSELSPNAVAPLRSKENFSIYVFIVLILLQSCVLCGGVKGNQKGEHWNFIYQVTRNMTSDVFSLFSDHDQNR